MAEVKITAEHGMFEARPFHIAQAQRLLVRHILNSNLSDQKWMNDYAEDIYVDSFNSEFPSFYLCRDDGYFHEDTDSRKMMLKSAIVALICELETIEYKEIVERLMQFTRFDAARPSITPGKLAVTFLPHFKIDEYAAKRNIIDVLENVVKLLS